MTSTPIAKMVREMIAKGVDPDVIELAVSTAEQMIIPRNSVETAEEKRKRKDRERKRISKENPGNSTEIPRNDENASLSIENKKKENKEKREANRGQRLPDDWAPSPPDTVIADEMLGADRRRAELEKFRDHWKQQPGSKGVKLDWNAAWRNWIRRAAEYRGGMNGNRTGNPRASGHDAILAVASRKARELDRNDEMAGSAGAPGFAFGDGAQPAASNGSRGAAEADRDDYRRNEPDDQRIREGEIIPPDKDAAGIPGRRQFV